MFSVGIYFRLCMFFLALLVNRTNEDGSEMEKSSTRDIERSPGYDASEGNVEDSAKLSMTSIKKLLSKALVGTEVIQTMFFLKQQSYSKIVQLKDIDVQGRQMQYLEIAKSGYTGATIVLDARYVLEESVSSLFIYYVLKQITDRLNENLSLLTGVRFIILPQLKDNRTHDGKCHNPLETNFDIGTPDALPCEKRFFTEPEAQAVSAFYSKVKLFKLYLNVRNKEPTIGIPFAYREHKADTMSSMTENMKNVINTFNIEKKVQAATMHDIYGVYSGSPVDYVHERLSVPYSMEYSLKTYSIMDESYDAYFAALKYAILEIQLTDPDVAFALLSECYDKGGMLHLNTAIVVYAIIVVMLMYYKEL